MVYLCGHHIIKYVKTYLLCVVSSVILISCCSEKVSAMPRPTLSIENEQVFWEKWIKENDDKTCPLEPFYFEDKKVIDEFNNELKSVDSLETLFLVIDININNGYRRILSISMADDNKSMSFIKWDGAEVKRERKFDDKLSNYYTNIHLTNGYTFVDLNNRYILGGNSTYVLIYNKGDVARFAFYNMATGKGKANKKVLSGLIDYLIDRVRHH